MFLFFAAIFCCLTTTLQTSISSSVTDPTPLPTTPSNHISLPDPHDPSAPGRRVFPTLQLANGWHVQTAVFECALPATTAAPILDHFYQNIIRWTLVTRCPEIRLFRLRLGILTLEFQCGQAVISWYFVRRFAEMMLASTRQGFIGAYQIFYNHYEGVRIMVALYIDL